MPPKKNYHVCAVDASQARLLRTALVGKDFQFRDVPYAEWGALTKEVNVTLYSKGKLVIQGKGTADFVQFFLEPEILKTVSFGYEAMFAEEAGHSHMGVDESGKGDYFGPLVVAAVFVEKDKIGKLVDLGVRDSKKLSEAAVKRLGKIIKGLCPFSLVVIGPERYNLLYQKIGNLNRLLAWGHARAIENVTSKVECKSVVIDQFASEHLVLRALMEKGKTLEIKQMHRGEADIAVAAASVLARNEFLERMESLSTEEGVLLPRGGGAAVSEAAKKLYGSKGLEGLRKIAKLHFKITENLK